MPYTLNDRERARMDAGADRIAAIAKAKGWKVSDEEIRTLPSVRIFALTDEPMDSAQVENELRGLDGVGESIARDELRHEIENGSEDAFEAQFAGLSPIQRINRARELGLDATRSEPTRQKLTPEQEAAAYRKILTLNPQARLNEARRLGIEV